MIAEVDSLHSRAADLSGARQARFILIGGFLAAGKTSALGQLGRFLLRQGCNPGFITNDQGEELVDTAILRAQGLAAQEVTGGSLASRFNSFIDVTARMPERDVYIAESVGNAADLLATVLNPFRRAVGSSMTVAPVSVLLDPVLAARILAGPASGGFSQPLAYLYRKQLEEADLIVINKSDLVSAPELFRVRQLLEHQFSTASIFEVSTRTGAGLDQWFEALLNREHTPKRPLELDSDLCQSGEASLGWLNCTVRFSSIKYFDAGKILTDLAVCIQALLQQENAQIAHLKMIFSPLDGPSEIAGLNLVRNDARPELSSALTEPVSRGSMILNLRAEASPELLHSAVTRGLLALMEKSPDLFARMEHCQHFQPGSRRPMHRIATLVN